MVSRSARLAEVRTLLEGVFAEVERQLDPWSARALWASVVPGMKRGARAGTRDKDRDLFLLHLYDYVASLGDRPLETIPGHLGKLLYERRQALELNWKPSTPEAAEKMIRRLVRDRAEKPGAGRLLYSTLLSSAGL